MKKSNKIQQAIEFAQTHLGDKTRLSGELYIGHSLKVMRAVEKARVTDETVLISSLLQHIDKSKDSLIKASFGEEILLIVAGLRKLTEIDISIESPKKNNDKYFLQTYLNLIDDLRVLIIRIIEKSVNIETAHKLDYAKTMQTAEKALYLYSPVARILGFQHIASELENDAFKILHPDHYYNIKKLVEKKKPEIKKFFLDAILFLQATFSENGINAVIKTRVKHYYSIFRKALKYNDKGEPADNNYENVYDIAGMRIIVNTVEECYLTESILKKIWDFYPEKRDDYIKNPKPSGYQSLQDIFKINSDMNLEVQIRTHEMHEINEFGTASHFFYKVGNNLKTQILDNPNWLKEINYWETQSSQEKNTKIIHTGKFVYAFTPKGDIIELPRGANIVDFAYYVHTKLGHNCTGGIVNGNIVKLDYQIKDGDMVEIMTNKLDKKPSRDWLKVAVTRRAINAIRKALGITVKNTRPVL